MQHPFVALEPEYARLLQGMTVTRGQETDATARRLLRFIEQGRYGDIATQTGVPTVWTAAVFERESGSDFNCSLAQGDPWNKVSVNEPSGRGPFHSWTEAARDALHYDHIDLVTDWAWPRACFEGELWNGFGPRNHSIYTGYLWAGTSIYRKGKYISDGHWDPEHVDTQLGIVPIMRRMVELEASLDFGQPLKPGLIVVRPPVVTPIGVGGPLHDTQWLQAALNTLGSRPSLLVDGSYGRLTKAAVRAFQASHGLDVDGLAGPKTIAGIGVALAA
jgi:lysozyme family protein